MKQKWAAAPASVVVVSPCLLDAYKKIGDHLHGANDFGSHRLVTRHRADVYFRRREILNYITPPVVKQMAVDGTQNELMTVRMDITFPRVPCSVLSVDAYDQSGKSDSRRERRVTQGKTEQRRGNR